MTEEEPKVERVPRVKYASIVFAIPVVLAFVMMAACLWACGPTGNWLEAGLDVFINAIP